MSYYGSDYDESDYEDATDNFNDGFEDFSQQDVISEDGSFNGEENYDYDESEIDDAFFQAQDMFFEENENFNSSDSDYGPQSELDFHDELDEEENSASDKQFSSPTMTYCEDILDLCKQLKDLLAQCKSDRVAKRSVKTTKVKVSTKVITAPITSPPSASESPDLPLTTSFTDTPIIVKVDSSEDSDPLTDDEFSHMPPCNFELEPCLTQSTIFVNSSSPVDAENTMEGTVLDLSVVVNVHTKEESPLELTHADKKSPQFSIIPTTQTYKDLFHTCTLHKFELGRDPPVVLNVCDSKSGFGLVQKFKRLFHTCTLHKFELGRDPPNVLDIGDSRFGFG